MEAKTCQVFVALDFREVGPLLAIESCQWICRPDPFGALVVNGKANDMILW